MSTFVYQVGHWLRLNVFYEAAFANEVLVMPTPETSGPLKNRVINRAGNGQRDGLMPSDA
jgi:hypothetical protein